MVSSSPFCSSVAGLVFGEKEREREEDEEEKEMKEPDGRIMERCMPPMRIHTCNMKGACPQCQLLIHSLLILLTPQVAILLEEAVQGGGKKEEEKKEEEEMEGGRGKGHEETTEE